MKLFIIIPLHSNLILKSKENITLIDTILSVKLSNGSQSDSNRIDFFSSPYFEETKPQYEYIGHIDDLGVFILLLHFWEDSDYRFYSTITGKELLQTLESPEFSPKGDKFISSYTSPYYEVTDLQLCKITNTNQKEIRFETVWNIEFKNWMMVEAKNNLIWISNNTFILKVLQSNYFWNKDGDFNKENFQYLKITLL